MKTWEPDAGGQIIRRKYREVTQVTKRWHVQRNQIWILKSRLKNDNTYPLGKGQTKLDKMQLFSIIKDFLLKYRVFEWVQNNKD